VHLKDQDVSSSYWFSVSEEM